MSVNTHINQHNILVFVLENNTANAEGEIEKKLLSMFNFSLLLLFIFLVCLIKRWSESQMILKWNSKIDAEKNIL